MMQAGDVVGQRDGGGDGDAPEAALSIRSPAGIFPLHALRGRTGAMCRYQGSANLM